MNTGSAIEIDPEIRPVVEELAKQIPATRRDNYLQMRELNFPVEIPPTVTSERKSVSHKDVDVEIVVRRPLATANSSAILWFHGGGHVMGTADDGLSVALADELGVPVYSVEYRLAPE